MVFVHDAECRIIDANRAYLERVGQPRETVVGRPYWEVFPLLSGPLDGCRRGLKRAQQLSGQVCAPGELESSEEITLDSGEVFLSRSFVMRTPAGAYWCSVHLLEEVTERRRQERHSKQVATALREREAQLQQLFANMTEGVLVVDQAGAVVYANSAAARLFARSSWQIIGQVIGLPIGGPDAQEIELYGPQGTFCTVEMRVRDVRWHGEPAHLVNLRDVTEHKRVEGELRQAAVVFEESHEGIVIADAEQRVIAVNRAFSEITGYSEEEAVGTLWALLGSDLHEPAFYEALLEAVERHGLWTGELWSRRRDGSSFAGLVTVRDIRDEIGQRTHYLTVFSDISRVKEYQSQLERLLHADPLTGLPNRALFQDRLEQAVVAMQRATGTLAVYSLDIRDLKSVNFTLGVEAGDALLQQVGARLRQVLSEQETVARLGGDEFGVLCPGLRDVDAAGEKAEQMLKAVQQPYRVAGKELHLSVCIGLSVFPGRQLPAHELFQQANAAMEQAKQEGVAYRFFSEELTEQTRERVQLGSELRYALERGGQLAVHYQPQVDLRTGCWIGMEALARWRHPQRGWVPPGRFIPVAERVGLIELLGDWVFEQACIEARAWLDAGYDPGRIGVNFAAPELVSTELVDKTLDILARTGLPPSHIELEITESLFVDPHAETIGRLEVLRQHGMRVAIDDFGTGYSALSYLRDLPIDRLKIDRSFVTGLSEDPRLVAITRAIAGLGESLGFEVIAEGIETEAQRQILLDAGCFQGQGYLFARPCAAADLDLRHFAAPLSAT
nr:bifunctional diguanylate cyclase/phosphodiesterase [Halorhodospira abdelmalekii]